MERKKRIEEEVMKTLEAFESHKPIEGSSFFFTRLQAKIREREEQTGVPSRWAIFTPRYLRLALLLCIVMLNIFSAVWLFQQSDSQADIREQYVTVFADEYALNQQEYDLFSQTVN